MVHIFDGYSLFDRRMAMMFEDRKKLFVDLMAWNVPVIDGRYEIDRFDSDDATYLLALDTRSDHIGSMRLLPTTSPHILSDIFPQLCRGGAPRGKAVMEITRLCLPSRLGAGRRLAVRNRLISAMVDHALAMGICTFTGVVTWSFLQQIMAMGWRGRPLGDSTVIGGARLGAFRVEIDDDTPKLLAEAGIYTSGSIAVRQDRDAA